MDHISLFKQSFHTAWRYRALWLFGLLVALTTSSASIFFTSSSWQEEENEPFTGINVSPKGRAWLKENLGLELPENREILPIELTWSEMTSEEKQTVYTIVGVAIGSALLVLLIAAAVRSLAQTALIKMVDAEAETGTRYSTRQGLRLGWSRSAWRVFLVDLFVRLPFALFILTLLAASLAPVLVPLLGDEEPGLLSFVATGGMFLFLMGMALLGAVLLSVITPAAHRAAVLDKLGPFQAIGRGVQLVRYNLRDLGLTWLVLTGIDLVWPVLTAPIAIALVILGGIGALLIGLVVLAIGGFSSIGAWIVAGILAFGIFFVVVGIPMAFVNGLGKIFASSAWTLTYREVRELTEKVENAVAALPAT